MIWCFLKLLHNLLFLKIDFSQFHPYLVQFHRDSSYTQLSTYVSQDAYEVLQYYRFCFKHLAISFLYSWISLKDP